MATKRKGFIAACLTCLVVGGLVLLSLVGFLFYRFGPTTSAPQTTVSPSPSPSFKQTKQRARSAPATPSPTPTPFYPLPTLEYPTSITKTPLVPEEFAELDRYAIRAPLSVEETPKTLAAYLIKPTHTDKQKAWVIYRWIAEHITYDYQAYKSMDLPSENPAVTLKNHMAVCGGYARLYCALAREAGLACEYIPGYCKGTGFKGALDNSFGHAWNAVSIDGILVSRG